LVAIALVLSAAALLLLARNAPISRVDEALLRVNFALRGANKPPSQVTIVYIDKASMMKLGDWPWPSAQLGELLNAIADSQPKAVGINILLPALCEAAADAACSAASRIEPLVIATSCNALVQPEWSQSQSTESTRRIINGNIELLRGSSGDALGIAGQLRAGIELVSPCESVDFFSVALARAAGFQIPDRNAHASRALLTNYAGAKGTVHHVSAIEIVDGSVSAELRDRIVIVGADIGLDESPTPVGTMPLTEIHANLTANAVFQDYLATNLWITIGLAILVATGVAFAIAFRRLVALVGIAIAATLGLHLAFRLGVLVPTYPLFAAVVFGVALSYPLRLSVGEAPSKLR
jgi:CHASE2 domain-containing sensor protein